MNREIVCHILDVLKTSTDKNVILKGLVKLRTDLVKDRDGIVLFHQCNGIPPMVRFLNKPHEQILEVVLSILGNCCTNADCCKEALDNKIAIPLATILKSIPNTLIQCRACRLLGNLAKVGSSKLLSTHCPAIASAVCQIIEESDDVQTQIMCFRACRFLVVEEHFLRHFLVSDGFTLVLKTLVGVMKNKEIPEPVIELPQKTGGLKKNQHREKYFEEVARNLEGPRSDIFDHATLKNSKICMDYIMPEEKANIELASEILKCLLIISEINLNYQAWEVVNRSNSLAAVVFFASEDNPYRATALKILSNFSKSLGAIHALGAADAIVAACELLVCRNMAKPLSASEIRHCINVICMLSGDACNRSKIRRSGAIGKLLDMARTSKSHTEISSILYVLNNFQYDNISMDLMLREGLIGILISELGAYLHSDDDYRKRKREERRNTTKKRKLPENSCESVCKTQKLRDESVYDFDSPCSSPRSTVTPSSPCSSRGMSPVGGGFKATSEMDSESETYSPVCSDDEGIDDDENIKTDPHDSDIMKLLDIACKSEINLEDNVLDKEDDEDESQDVPPLKLPKTGNSTIDIIENLIYRVTLLINKGGELSKPETLYTLIEAINIFGLNNCFCGSLTNILSESQFFAQIIKLGVAHQLFQMTKIDELKTGGFGFLETLTNVGETNYGKGELLRLLRSDDASHKRAAIAVGFIIKNHRILYHLLTDGTVLFTLINMILTGDSEFTQEAADALTAMSQTTLDIAIPDSDKESFDCDKIFDETKPFMQSYDSDMKFIVHDNNEEVSVGFNKKLLSDVSEVFNSMLNSDFREGNEGEIHLKAYSASGLRYFLNLIELRSLNKPPNIPPVEKYKSAIEAFELSRVYIIPELEKILFSIMVYLLDESNCQSVLEWSMKNYHAELTEIAINFYLCSNIPTQNKVKLFRKADFSMYSNEWNQMITDAVLVRCKDTPYYDLTMQ
ncbi:uncharacterized protein LOC129913306 [Episyrphus balteatus]|uniref:uncharacterized protein LOC129913306 n=1 Tax=Episyrphus balteatus TaxID=286459 RepID=UPI002486C11D|nr:uncharacterized protein LOC129913306 [Episyrphus balteatus]